MPSYKFRMEFTDPSAPLFSRYFILQNVRMAASAFNCYYVTHNVPNPKQIQQIIPSVSGDVLEIDLDCQHALPVGREGNALRQFSRYLKSRVGNFSLTASYRHKLLKSK